MASTPAHKYRHVLRDCAVSGPGGAAQAWYPQHSLRLACPAKRFGYAGQALGPTASGANTGQGPHSRARRETVCDAGATLHLVTVFPDTLPRRALLPRRRQPQNVSMFMSRGTRIVYTDIVFRLCYEKHYVKCG